MTPKGWRAAFLVGELALLLAVPVLAVVGFSAVLDTTDGRVVDPELDPDEPGYEAFVESTPTLAVLGTDAEGQLSWAAAMALSGTDRAGGALFLIPVQTLVPDFAVQWRTLAETFAAEGSAGAQRGMSNLLGAAMNDVVALSPERLGSLVGPASPVTVVNPDPVAGFAAGQLALAAADTAAFLEAAADGESDLTRLTRHEAFWRAWLAVIGASGAADVVPGETSTGFGRFVRGLAAGPVSVDVPPVTPSAEAEGSARFDLDWAAAVDLAEDRIPFPAAPAPGGRVRVRVLDGVGADGMAVRAGRDAVDAGGQLVLVGNADAFDATTTRVVYFETRVEDAAERVAAAFRTEAEQLDGPNPDDGVDVTVVAGADLLSAYGLTARTTTIGEDPG